MLCFPALCCAVLHCVVRLAGALEATPSAASQLARFLSAFQASHGDSVSGVTFVVNGSAFEAFVEAPTEALFRLMQALSDHCAVAAASSGGSASSTRPSTRQPLPARAASSSSPSSRFSPPAWGLCGVCWVKVLSFVEATPRVFPFFAVRALRVAGVFAPFMLGSITPSLGVPLDLTSFAVIVIGSLGNPLGTVLGGVVFGVCLMLMRTYLSSFADLLPNLVLILVLLVKPTGLLGRSVRHA